MKRVLDSPRRTVLALALGLAGTFGLATNLVRTTWTGYPYRTQREFAPVPLDGQLAGNSVFLLAVWAGLTLLALVALKRARTRRLRRTALLLAVLAALAETVGGSVNYDNSLWYLYGTPMQVAKTLIHLVGYGAILYCAFAVVLAAAMAGGRPRPSAAAAATAGASPAAQAGPRPSPRLWAFARDQWRRRPRRFAVLMWAVFCVARLPYLLAWFPAVIPVDAMVQIRMALGDTPITGHHPLAQTALLGLFAGAGQAAGSVKLGVAAYSVFLIMASSAVFVYAVLALKRWGVRTGAVFGAAALFALWPLVGMYSVNALKDVPFALGVLGLVTALVGVLRRPSGEKVPLTAWAACAGFLTVVALWRNNGIYVVVLTVVALVAFAAGRRRGFLAVGGVAVLVYGLYVGPVYAVFVTAPGDSREAMSLPAQQMGRAIHEHYGQLTDSQKALVDKIFSVDGWVRQNRTIDQAYNPRLADFLKNQIDSQFVAEHAGEVLRLYADLAVAYPGSYVNATLTQTLGYWYPEAIEAASQVYVADPNPYGLSLEDSLAPGLQRAMLWASWGSPRPVPVVSMLFSIGFAVGVVVLALAVLLLKRRGRLALAMAPLLGVWASCLLSPAFAEFRYALGLVWAAPVVALAAWYAASGRKVDSGR